MPKCPRGPRSQLLPVVLLRLFARLVVADDAAGRRADYTVMARNMTGNAANGGAFETTFGIGWRNSDGQGKGQCGVTEKGLHWVSSILFLSQFYETHFRSSLKRVLWQ